VHRRLLLAAGSAAVLAATARVSAQPAAFPDPARPIRFVVPFPPGGTSDLRARQVAERLKADAGWNVVVENKPGASGIIGSDLVAKAVPDGHTLLLGTIGTLAINPGLLPQPYDVARDFQPVTQFSRSVSMLCAHRDAGVASLAALEAKVKGGAKLAYASTGNASIGHMVGETYKRRAGIDLVHVPYQGTAPAVRDFVGGQVPLLFETPSAVWPHLQSGVVVPLAVTSAERMPQLPAVPTFAESGHRDIVFDTWQGVVTRRGVAPEVLAALHREIVRALRHPEVVKSQEEQVNVVVANTPEQFERLIASETQRWKLVIAETGVKAG
jgi:tripartite-type tricarboxylate transporter receptor subunit TctC